MKKQALKTIKSNFLHELQDASAGKKTSLPFIVHKLSSSSLVQTGEPFQVMVIGGSVFKKAICKNVKGKIAIIKKETDKPLNFKTEQDFLEFIERELPNDVRILALNFAYPIQPVFENGKLDGILLGVTKEGGFHGLVGEQIGKEIENYVLAKRNKKIKVAVANDTVCLLLSGLTKYPWDVFGGGVDGTGVNFAFFLSQNSLVNLESANFNKFQLTQEGKIIDKKSQQPEKHLFEKETAGAYLYKHFNIIVKERGINYSQIVSTEELSALCHPEFISGSKNQVQHDRIQVSEIAKSLMERSAQLVACQIAGITAFKGHDMVFNMEGSLFWKGNRYKETVEETVRLLVPEYNVKFVEMNNSAILGAAKLVA